MLDHDLAELATNPPDMFLQGLEQAIWSKVAVLARLRRVERLTSRLQFAALGMVLIVSMAVGMRIGAPSDLGSGVIQISSSAADLAPSTLFGVRP